MKKMFILFAVAASAFVAFIAAPVVTTALFAARPNSQVAVGTFTVIAFAKHRSSPILSDNQQYLPIHGHYRDQVRKDWKLNDSITVVRTDNYGEYQLINTTIGTSIKAKIAD